MTKFVFLIFSILWGCERWEEREEKEKPIKKKLEENLVATVREQWFIGPVKVGDIFHFEISVGERGEQLSEVYVEDVTSCWSDRKCIQSPIIGKPQCTPWKDHVGRCEVYYRNYKGLGMKFLDLSKQAQWPFKITVGGVPVPLDDDFTVGPTTLRGKLSVNETMVVKGDDLTIEVIKGEAREVRVGFMGFGECEGLEKSRFNVETSRYYEMLEQQRLREMKITVRRKSR